MKKIILLTASLMFGCDTIESLPSDRYSQQFSSEQTEVLASDSDISEIKNIKPQTKKPLSVAVLAMERWNSFDLAEKEKIYSWGNELQRNKKINGFSMIPDSMTPSCASPECILKESRQMAARMHANVIVYLSGKASTESSSNLLSILNLTIVGLWVVPAHQRDSVARFDAAIVDVDSGYLYESFSSAAESKNTRPFMFVDFNTGQKEARDKALSDLLKQVSSRFESAPYW